MSGRKYWTVAMVVLLGLVALVLLTDLHLNYQNLVLGLLAGVTGALLAFDR